MNKANLYAPAANDVLFVPAVVNKNNLHASCFYNYNFKDFTNFFAFCSFASQAHRAKIKIL